MEAKFVGNMHQFYGPVVSDLKAMGKRSMEWDLNDWRWDGDLFLASQLNSVPSDCRSRQFFPVGSDIPMNNGVSNSYSSGSDEMVLENEREKRDLEKRRRVIEVENEQVNEDAALNLKLGGQAYPVIDGELDKWEGKNGKKVKISGAPSSRAVCQVQDCKADLSNAKDYHRRHKVCDVHSKATRALVGNTMQRFCQQCSRFHVLEEFDEGKRSCRRRLAGHNKRRRKTHPENEVNAGNPNDERANRSDETKDQDLLSHILRNLGNVNGAMNERNPSGLLPIAQDLQNLETTLEAIVKDSTRNTGPCLTPSASDLARKYSASDTRPALPSPADAILSIKEIALDTATGRRKLNDFDLNNAYDASQDCTVDAFAPQNLGSASPVGPLWLYKDSQQSSPPHNSANSGLTSSQSPSTSSGEAQSRTDRIVFKLFGKDPSDFPLALRKQILDWLSNSPTDIESYIRPGCIILTIYLCMDESNWEELYCNLSSSLRRLLDSSVDPFWRTGWIYTRVGHRVTFVYNGQVVLDTPSPLKSYQSCTISSIKPIAVAVSEEVQFEIKGFNLSRPTSRLLCALEGTYLISENCSEMTGASDSCIENDEIQCLSFSCVVPNIVGRGFIEIEDHGLSGSFFPFIVAEKDVCSEICTLESILEISEDDGGDISELEQFKNQALDFIHEFGWLLHRNRLKFKLSKTSSDGVDLFPFKRFRWLIEFSIDHDWCAVVGKLLNILLLDGLVDSGEYKFILVALLDVGLLHRAVRRNCRSMVEFLLKYNPKVGGDGSHEKQPGRGQYVFMPDAVGPGGLTPLHVAASLDGCEDVLDALTEDPGSVGLDAWKNARDSAGLTPYDYACLRSHYSYINLVQTKLNKRIGHVVLDIHGANQHKFPSKKLASFQIQREKNVVGGQCGRCERVLAYGSSRASSPMIYRPTMLSMVAIACVCVCAALLFKSSPEVFCSFRPFIWERLGYGSQ